jgi:hypothetical protein
MDVIYQVGGGSPHCTAESRNMPVRQWLKAIYPSPLQVSEANDASGLPGAYPGAL